jgi:hypothetical protein
MARSVEMTSITNLYQSIVVTSTKLSILVQGLYVNNQHVQLVSNPALLAYTNLSLEYLLPGTRVGRLGMKYLICLAFLRECPAKLGGHEKNWILA